MSINGNESFVRLIHWLQQENPQRRNHAATVINSFFEKIVHKRARGSSAQRQNELVQKVWEKFLRTIDPDAHIFIIRRVIERERDDELTKAWTDRPFVQPDYVLALTDAAPVDETEKALHERIQRRLIVSVRNVVHDDHRENPDIFTDYDEEHTVDSFPKEEASVTDPEKKLEKLDELLHKVFKSWLDMQRADVRCHWEFLFKRWLWLRIYQEQGTGLALLAHAQSHKTEPGVAMQKAWQKALDEWNKEQSENANEAVRLMIQALDAGAMDYVEKHQTTFPTNTEAAKATQEWLQEMQRFQQSVNMKKVRNAYDQDSRQCFARMRMRAEKMQSEKQLTAEDYDVFSKILDFLENRKR